MEKISCSNLKPNEIYDALTSVCVPRPLFWGCTHNEDKSVNIAPFSFVTIASINPPHLLISIGKKKGTQGDKKSQTLKNIEREQEVTLNTATNTQLNDLMKAYIENDYDSINITDKKMIEGTPISLFCHYIKTIDEESLDTYLVLVKIDHIIKKKEMDINELAHEEIVGCFGGRSFIKVENLIELK